MNGAVETRLQARCRVPYPGFRLDADLELGIDGVCALFGPSGSGKTTLLRVIAGLERLGGSRVAVDGEVWQDDSRGAFVPPHRRNVGFVFQDSRLFPHLSVRGNLEFGLRRTPAAQRLIDLDRVVRVLDLEPLLRRRPLDLSGGERQRVAIARAVVTSPRLLLMDEPLASLDGRRREEILSFIERLVGELRLPVLYVSHAIDEVLRLSTRLVLISAGRIVGAGDIDDITSRLDLRPYTDRLDAGAVMRVSVAAHDRDSGITRLSFPGGELLGPLLDVPVGTGMNLRIRSRDVALSLTPPEATSFLNVLPGRVVEISAEEGPQAHVLLDVGRPLWARIMKRSVKDLGLVKGMTVYALIKAVAIDQRSLGRPTAMDLSLSGDID